MHRFFVERDLIDSDMIKIEGNDFNHIARSLRLQPDDKIVVCPGDGRDFLVRLEKFDDNYVLGRIVNRKQNKNEPDVNITLAQAIPKNRNMEMIVEKCTEIGIKKIIPLLTERTIVKLGKKKKMKRRQRWQRIAEAAAKQSQRGIIPEIEDINNLKKITNIKSDFDLVLVCWTGEKEKGLRNFLSQIELNMIKDILIIIGPEGGFRVEEIELICQEIGGYSVNLGSRILRTETAGLVVLSLLLYEVGDIGG